MSKRKKIEPVEADVVDSHEEMAVHVEYVVGHLLPSMAEHWGLCLTCFGNAIIAEIQQALACAEAHRTSDDEIGEPRGSA